MVSLSLFARAVRASVSGLVLASGRRLRVLDSLLVPPILLGEQARLLDRQVFVQPHAADLPLWPGWHPPASAVGDAEPLGQVDAFRFGLARHHQPAPHLARRQLRQMLVAPVPVVIDAVAPLPPRRLRRAARRAAVDPSARVRSGARRRGPVLEPRQEAHAARRNKSGTPHHPAGLARMRMMSLRRELAGVDMPSAARRTPEQHGDRLAHDAPPIGS